MSKATPEPLFYSPLSDQLGYLTHAIEAIDIGSPDSLHGAAHYAPLTGLHLPILDLLADYNDSVIEAGHFANIDALKRMRSLTRQRLVAEQARLEAEGAPVATDDADFTRILNEIRWRGEAITAEIALAIDLEPMRVAIAEQLRSLLDAQSFSSVSENYVMKISFVNETLLALDNEDIATATYQVYRLLKLLSIPSLKELDS